MKRFRAILAAALLAGAAWTQSPTNFSGRASTSVTAPKETSEPAAAPATSQDPIAARIQALDLRQRASQLMIVTLQGGPAPNSDDVKLLRQYTPGGVITPPVTRPVDARDYIERIRQLPVEKNTGIPLLIGTNLYDLPKGRNLPNAFFFQVPSLLSVAAANDPGSTEKLGSLIADQLRAMGFNMNLGPSLELAPTLPGVKGSLDCLGSDPRFCAEAGGAILKALADKDLVAVPTGFPGGGANRMRRGPAVLLTAGPLLDDRELLPYRRAIEQGVPAIHVSNTVAPTIDPSDIPSSMSEPVMRGLLRRRLGFTGVIIAGPMDTPDIVHYEDPTVAAIKALQAGADMILWNQAGSRVMKTVDDIVTAVNSGALSQQVIDEALRRVLEMKERHGLMARELPKAQVAEKLERDNGLAEAAYDIERRAITLVQNRNNVLPLNKASSQPVGVTGEVGVEELQEALEEYLKHVAQQQIRSAKHAGRILDFEITRITARVRGMKTAICVFTNDGEIASKVELVSELQKQGVQVVVVLLGYPSALPRFADADAIVLAYCSEKAYAQTMRAVADVLVGQGPVAVLSVDRDLRLAVGERGVFNPLDVIRVPAGRLPVTIDDRYPAGLFVPYDPTFTLKKTLWTFGDGDKSKDALAKKVFRAPGRYPVTLTLVDKKGHTTTGTFYAVVE